MCINVGFKNSVKLMYKIYFGFTDIKVTLLYEKYINIDISTFVVLYFDAMSVGCHENFSFFLAFMVKYIYNIYV